MIGRDACENSRFELRDTARTGTIPYNIRDLLNIPADASCNSNHTVLYTSRLPQDSATFRHKALKKMPPWRSCSQSASSICSPATPWGEDERGSGRISRSRFQRPLLGFRRCGVTPVRIGINQVFHGQSPAPSSRFLLQKLLMRAVGILSRSNH